MLWQYIEARKTTDKVESKAMVICGKTTWKCQIDQVLVEVKKDNVSKKHKSHLYENKSYLENPRIWVRIAKEGKPSSFKVGHFTKLP